LIGGEPRCTDKELDQGLPEVDFETSSRCGEDEFFVDGAILHESRSLPRHANDYGKLRCSASIEWFKAEIQAYESLWDDITKQFLQHTDETVLTSAIQAINELTLNTALANSNTTKLIELTESLFTSLRDAINGQDVATMSIDEEEIASLEAILFRLTLLGKSRDITEVMEDEEGGQSSGWEIVCAFAERGELPYRDEAKVSSQPPSGAWLRADG
jgi:hypothetical protein